MSAALALTSIVQIELGKPRVEASVTVHRSGGVYNDYHVSDRGWEVRVINSDGITVGSRTFASPVTVGFGRNPGSGLDEIVQGIIVECNL